MALTNGATTDVAISVENLSYFYPKTTKPAVQQASFTVRRGEIFGLLGPSGAGKSTTQKVLTRQQRRFDGQISSLGKRLGEWDNRYYEHIGVGFELPNHYLKLTGLENLKFFGSLYSGPVRDPMELMELVGLEEHAKKKVDEYSKGMRMRLNFIRAIQHDPELLFLDEPTAGLDPVNARNIKNIVRDLSKQGKTIVLTTHNMNDVDELCDWVSFMVDGRLAALDTPEALKAQFGRRTVRVTYGTGHVPEAQEFPFEGLAANKDFLALLDRTDVRTIHSQEATLDQVFNDVTGVRLDAVE